MANGLPTTRDMIAQLIATPSVSCVSPDHDMSNRAVIDLLAEWSEGLGFSTEVQAVNEVKYNLIARAGSGSDGLVLSGHTDTVPCDPALWFGDPFEAREADDRIYGLGSCDMKSFLALALTASSKVDLDRLNNPLTLVATADEESTMSGARLIADNGRKLGAYCVIGEPTSLSPIRQHKGVLTMSVEFVGQSGHASDPSLGNNALDGMHQFMTALYQYRDRIQQRFNDPAFKIPTPTMNLGHIHGGDNSNRICGACTLLIDIRYLPGMSFEQLHADIDQLGADIAGTRGLKVKTRVFGEGLPPMDTAEASEIAQYLTHITGKKTSSVAFGQAHQPDEFLPLAQIDPTINMLESLIERFCLT
jgi:acetylornithine deacetylase